MKLDPVVKKENLYMIIGSAVCTAVVQLVFWALGKYDTTVLFGGLWGFFITVLNFFIMTVAIQKAMASGDEQQAKMKIQASYSLRMLLLAGLMIVGVVLPFMHWIPVLISVFYPRIIITVRGAVTSFRNRGKEIPASSGAAAYEEDAEDEEEDGLERMVGFFGAKAAKGIKEMNHTSDSGQDSGDGKSENHTDKEA